MRGPKEKKERSLGVHLNVKAERCQGPKCAATRRPTRPGIQGTKRRRGSPSDFSRQLLEKQKFKISYGLGERNLKQLFERAEKHAGGDIAVKLMELMERRLDNVVFRAGFAGSRSMARQLINHGHITVNKKRVRAPGYQVREKDVMGIYGEHASKITVFKELKEKLMKYEAPVWLAVDPSKFEAVVLALPRDTQAPFEINLLVESFSK